MKIQEVWNMLVTGRSLFDIDCWWLRHNEASNVLIINNRGKHGLLNMEIKIYYLSGTNHSIILPRLKADSAMEVMLSAFSSGKETPSRDAVAVVVLKHGTNTYCFKNSGNRLTASTHKLENIVHKLPVWQPAIG
jgi:hypothetical protein